MFSFLQLAKVATVIVFGFLFTLLTTSLSVLGVRQLSSAKSMTPEKSQIKVEKPKKPFSPNTLYALACILASTGLIATRTSLAIARPARTLYMLSTTLFCFVFGARLPPKVTKIVHPLVTCTCLTWVGALTIGVVTGTPILDMLRLYKTGLLTTFSSTGAGDILQFMLGPAVVALSCQMYDRKDLMRQNLKEVGTAVLVSSLGGLFGTAFFVRASRIASPSMRLSLLSRNITSPLAMAIASMLGADLSLAVSIVVISGLIGANCGAYILDRAKIKEPVARGLGIGAAAHGLGTAALSNEPDAFPFAAISMALTASFSTILVSLPFVRDLLIRISLGS
jgi:putative effector of murein hydrolase